MLFLRKPNHHDVNSIAGHYQRSKEIHQPWSYPPHDFEGFVRDEGRYLLCFESMENIVGTFQISGIMRGYFQSGYLGYDVFHPHQGKGYMREGMKLIIKEAFEKLELHRLEANIQPDNVRSIKLAEGSGFIKEGYSKDYINVGGKGWKDHERWAIVNNN